MLPILSSYESPVIKVIQVFCVCGCCLAALNPVFPMCIFSERLGDPIRPKSCRPLFQFLFCYAFISWPWTSLIFTLYLLIISGEEDRRAWDEDTAIPNWLEMCWKSSGVLVFSRRRLFICKSHSYWKSSWFENFEEKCSLKKTAELLLHLSYNDFVVLLSLCKTFV